MLGSKAGREAGETARRAAERDEYLKALKRALTDACDVALRALACGVAVEAVQGELRRRIERAPRQARQEAAERLKEEAA